MYYSRELCSLAFYERVFMKKCFVCLLLIAFNTVLFAQSLDEYANLISSGKCRESLPGLEKLSNSYAKQYGATDTSHYALSLVYLMRTYNCLSMTREFENVCYTAKKVFESNDALMNTYYAEILHNLGILNEKSGNIQNAELFYRQELLIKTKLYGSHHLSSVETLVTLGNFFKSISDFSQSEQFFNDAFSVLHEMKLENSLMYAQNLLGYGALQIQIQNFSKAERYLQEAMQIFRDSLGVQSDEYLLALNNIAVVCFYRSDFEEAGEYFAAVCDAMRQQGRGNTYDYAIYLQNLASVYLKMGNYEAAGPLLDEALQLTAYHYGTNNPGYANVEQLMAFLEFEKRNYPASENYLADIIRINKKINGKNSIEYARAVSAMSTLKFNIAKKTTDKALQKQLLVEALQLSDDALGIIAKIAGTQTSMYAYMLSGQSAIYDLAGDFSHAVSTVEKSIEIFELLGDVQSDDYLNALNNAAAMYFSRELYEKADGYIAKSLETLSNEITGNFRFLSEKEKEYYVDSRHYLFETYKSYFLVRPGSKGEMAENFYNLELLSKAMVLNSGIELRHIIENASDAAALDAYDDWLLTRSVLARQYSLPEIKRSVSVDSLEKACNKLEVEWTKYSSRLASLRKNTWRDVQQQLKPGEVALEFTCFNFYNKSLWTDTMVYVALLVQPGLQQPEIIRLCTQQQLDTLILALGVSSPGQLTRMYRGIVFPDEEGSQDYGQSLYNLLWAPVEAKLGPEVTRIFYAPAASLHQISLAAIPINDSLTLSDRYRLMRLTTTASLLQNTFNDTTAAESLVVYGGIDFDIDPAQQIQYAALYNNTINQNDYSTLAVASTYESRGENWNYLPGTLSEAKAIQLIALKSNCKTNLISGGEAVEESFKWFAGTMSPDIIHVATHGYFFPNENKQDLQTFFSRNENQQVFKKHENPLQRSGLLLAGANNAWKGRSLPPEIEDGILTAYEISNMYLPNTKLVVLSACETGLGDLRGDEGVFGLQRAFKTAGVQYIIMSLWKVPDIETSEFMQVFYSLHFGGLSIPDAFDAAQTEMRNKYRNEVFKWAAFVLLF